MNTASEAIEFLKADSDRIEAIKRRLGYRGERFMEPRKAKQIDAPKTDNDVEILPERLPFKIGRKRYVMMLPDWMREDIQADDHMRLWRKYAGNKAACYIHVRAEELGFVYKDMVGYDKRTPQANARQMLYWELRQMGYPYPQIGRFMGGRDHTSVLHGVKKISAMLKNGGHVRGLRRIDLLEYVPQVAG